MIFSPKIGQHVQLWYKNRQMPLHGRYGIVEIVSHGKPRNHGVRVEGRMVVVPCGNLRPVPQVTMFVCGFS